MNYKKMSNSNNSNGITLIELVVAMFIAGIVSIAIFTAFKSQQKSYLVQDQVAEMQQNIRAGMDLIVREIRMAGYDPHGDSGAGITAATGNTLTFTLVADDDCYDNDSDNTTDETGELKTIQYDLYDAYSDGDNDIGRQVGSSSSSKRAVAENIEALGFAYAFDAVDANGTSPGDGILDTYNVGGNRRVIWAFDSDGDNELDTNLDTDGDGDIDENDGPGPGGNGLIAGQVLTNFGGFAIADVLPGQIRAVRIWILSRADREDPDFRNTKTYVVGSQVITPDDGFRRRLLTTTVQCRNMGL